MKTYHFTVLMSRSFSVIGQHHHQHHYWTVWHYALCHVITLLIRTNYEKKTLIVEAVMEISDKFNQI